MLGKLQYLSWSWCSRFVLLIALVAAMNESLLPHLAIRVWLFTNPSIFIFRTNLPSLQVYDLYYLNLYTWLFRTWYVLMSDCIRQCHTSHYSHLLFLRGKGVRIVTMAWEPYIYGCAYFHATGRCKFLQGHRPPRIKLFRFWYSTW